MKPWNLVFALLTACGGTGAMPERDDAGAAPKEDAGLCCITSPATCMGAGSLACESATLSAWGCELNEAGQERGCTSCTTLGEACSSGATCPGVVGPCP